MSSKKASLIGDTTKYLPELTLKVFILSALLAAVLAASNAYLAMKVGTTVSASIPASVLAMGLLKFFRRSNLLECNMIQTAASGGEGVAAAISFVLPALIITHVWQYFPFVQTCLLTILGGVLGVLCSIPLRRVLLDMPILRFPEGTAVGNLLRSAAKGSADQMKVLVKGAVVGSFIGFLQGGLKVIASTMGNWFEWDGGFFGLSFGFDPALVGAGFIIGIETCVCLLTGIVIGWIVLIPIFSFYTLHTTASVYDQVMQIWSQKLRFVGVGVMLVGGFWTLIRLLKVFARGIVISVQSLRKAKYGDGKIAREDRDTPIHYVFIGILIVSIGIYAFILHLLGLQPLYFSETHILLSSLILLVAIIACALLLTIVNGYLVGLIGSTNSPLSGMVIIALLILGFLTWLLFNGYIEADKKVLISLLLIVSTMVATCASIALENIQDLKAGQMVGSTPWKQQLILLVGVIVAALVIAPIMELLFQAYGIGGVFPHPNMNPSQMLAAPQAGIMSALATSVLAGGTGLPKGMILLGCGIALIIVVIDEYLRKFNKSLPPLAVGLGIYLPSSVLTPVVVGGVVSYLLKRKNSKRSAKKAVIEKYEHRGILLACGIVAGSALMGVILAFPYVILGNSDALRIMPLTWHGIANLLGIMSVLFLASWLYRISVIKEA